MDAARAQVPGGIHGVACRASERHSQGHDDGGHREGADAAKSDLRSVALASDAEDEEIKWALGETENAHVLSIALAKASTALQYTVAIRDKVLEAYKELMQIQI